MFQTKTIREKDVIGFEYNTSCGGKINIGIKFVPDDKIDKLRTQCQLPMKGNKVNFNQPLYYRMLAREAIAYINNATYEDINFITVPMQQVVLDPGKKWTDLVECDPEVIEWVINNMIEEFATFIKESCTEVEVFQKKIQDKEMQNLKNGSAAQPGN